MEQSGLIVVNLLWKRTQICSKEFFETICVANSPQFLNYTLLQRSLNAHFMPFFS